ncbi:MAG: hypothetical protein IIC80_06870 [Chloroflexi bacterium]|nr:hypothetical protein [Chloroflexota bacterium]MCH8284600.1 hypothetical protein [Chloroflexota bacterium]
MARRGDYGRKETKKPKKGAKKLAGPILDAPPPVQVIKSKGSKSAEADV